CFEESPFLLESASHLIPPYEGYVLNAVVDHSGSVFGGHYTCSGRLANGQWMGHSDVKKIKKIGKDKFGNVYNMQEISTQLIVAIKECDYDTDEEKEMVNKEVSVMRDIYGTISKSAQQSSSFLHIVQPLGFFINEDKAYFVMEYCAGGDLRKYINDLRKIEAEFSQRV
ncbi:MAG: hypothetical protein EZS28_045723, partial [Streblomastix strix]